jgi:hypothetical protein
MSCDERFADGEDQPPSAGDPMAPFQPMTFAPVTLPRNSPPYSTHRTPARPWVAIVRGRGRQNRVRTGVHRRSGPQLQLDALSAADCLKTDTDTATGTKAARPQWNACLTDLRPGDTLIGWEIDRPKSWAGTLVPPSRRRVTPCRSAEATSETAARGLARCAGRRTPPAAAAGR